MTQQNNTHTQTQSKRPKKPTLREYLNTTNDRDFAFIIAIMVKVVYLSNGHFDPFPRAYRNINNIIRFLNLEYDEDMFSDLF